MRNVPTRLTTVPLMLLAGVLLAACSPRPGEPSPIPETPPEPQATELRDAIQAPLDKARAVETTLDDAARAQSEAIEAATGAAAPTPSGG